MCGYIAATVLLLSASFELSLTQTTATPQLQTQINDLSCLLLGGEFCNGSHAIVTRQTYTQSYVTTPYRTYSPRNGYYGGNVVQVEVYSEAQCGDSTRFTRRQLWPTYQKFEHTRRLQVSVISFGKASCQPEAGDYNCRCQHGQRECDLNQLMNCVQDFYNNDPGKYLPVFACIQGKTDLDYAKDYCIANNPELPLETIMKCTTGRRGRRLLALAGQKTAALQPPLNNVPLIRVNGVKSIDAFYEFEETICNEMQPKPVECTK